MRGKSRALRAVSVAAFAIAPLAAVDVTNAAVETGDANAAGPGVAFENTGGNVELGKGHSESRTVIGDPAAGPAAPAARTLAPGLTTKAKPVIPGSDAVARAKALVEAARARAQAQIDAARQQAEEAQQRAHDQSEEARARSDAQSAEARARSEQSSGSSASSAD
jgi:hypothetical protein